VKYKILIADDATLNRVLVKNVLEKNLEDIVFLEAVNGKEVLEIVNNTEVDLIILDLIMPVLDGYETLTSLKANPKFKDIPVIVNSSITEIRSIELTLKEGAMDYFTKPLSPDEMKTILPLKVKNALLLYDQNRTIAALNRQINEELKNANAFANIMLPKTKDMRGIELFIKYYPSMGIGGDFFDCVEADDKIYFMVADVTGHGIAAGMASSMVKILFRKCIEKKEIMPHEILEDMNNSVFAYFDFAGKDNYLVFTAFVGVIDQGQLYYANAGQPYPMLYRKEDDSFEIIRENGFLIGMLEDITFETKQLAMNREDVIFLYTDGLFCTGSGKDFTGWESVFAIAENLKAELNNTPEDFLEEVFYSFHMIHKSKHMDFTDDVAMMLIKIS